jgi:translation initiation factor IF-3
MNKPKFNQQIREKEVRIVDETGAQLGVMSTRDALSLAREKGLDLVQVTEKVNPPVCKITDYGKYLYSLKKKDRKINKPKSGELKNIKLSFNMSDNDIRTRAKSSVKFLNNKEKVRIELRLRGRQNAFEQVAKDKMQRLLEFIKEEDQNIEIKIEKELKKQPRGLTMIISKK